MKIQNKPYNPNFQAGLSSKLNQEITSCDINKIAKEFVKYNIPTDFKNNKLVAWGCLKTLEINKSLNLFLPKAIILEDFSKLKVDPASIGFCNVAPTRLYKNNNDVIDENIIFFNSNYNWENLDKDSDINYENKVHSTNFFLEIFIHEFGHAAHLNNLLSKMSGEKFIKTIIEALKEENIENLQKKFINFQNICLYALTSPIEFVACDLAKRTIENINKNTLTVEKNFIPKSPFAQNSISSLFLKKDEVFRQTKNFWNGNLIV